MKFAPAIALTLMITACDRPQVERIDFAQAGSAGSGAELVVSASPDSAGARWSVAADGKGLRFGQDADTPYLSLDCLLAKDKEPRLAVIRHAQSQPGAKALFAVLGNGVISRLQLDAALSKGGWRWEGSYAADAPELDVFTGRRAITATLPGAGMLTIPGSGLPREFIDWCRRNGAARAPNTPGTPITPPKPAQ